MRMSMHIGQAIDPEVVSHIRDRIIQSLTDILLENERGNLPFETEGGKIPFEGVLEAIIETFTVEMSFACPGCLAHLLKRRNSVHAYHGQYKSIGGRKFSR